MPTYSSESPTPSPRVARFLEEAARAVAALDAQGKASGRRRRVARRVCLRNGLPVPEVFQPKPL